MILRSDLFESLTSIVLQVLGLSVAAIGLLALFGWLLDIPILTTWETHTLPMAPCTAMLSILFGGVFCFNVKEQAPTRMTTLFVWVGVLIALVLFTLRLFDIYWSVEFLGLPISGLQGDAPIGYISPITALGFLLANVALLFAWSRNTHVVWRVYLISGIAGLLTIISGMLLLSYIYGVPLPIGNTLIRPALNTSIILLFMGMGLLLFSYRRFIWSANLSGAIEINRLFYTLIFFALTATIFVVAYQAYHNTELTFRQGVALQLQAVSDLKTKELNQWRLERLGDGAIAQSAWINSVAQRQLEATGSIPAQPDLQDWFNRILHYSHFGYDRGFLLDAQGVIRMSVPAKSEPLAAVLKTSALASMQANQVMLQDFFWDESDQKVFLALLIPLLNQQEGNRPLGVIVLRIDPSIYLYPFIQQWPTVSATAETLLVRREDNDVLFLNDLRFSKQAALKKRIPLDKLKIPAVKVALGQRGMVEGQDYNGDAVLAVLSSIQDSSWLLVTKIAKSEVYAPLTLSMKLTALLAISLVCGVAAALFLLRRQYQLVLNKSQLESTLAAMNSTLLHNSLLHTSMDGFLLIDSQGGVLEVNDTYCRMSGYNEQELLNLSVADLEAVETAEAIIRHLQNTLIQGADRFETRHRRKDGGHFDVEVSMRYLSVNEGQFVVFVQDISPRKWVEEALQASKARLDFALQQSATGAWDLNLLDHTTHRTLLHDRIFGYQTLLPSWTYEIFLEHVLPEDRQEVDRCFHEAIAAQTSWRFECRIRRADGDVRWIYAAGDILRNARSETEWMTGIVQDITERKQSELKSQLLASIIQSSDDAILSKDLNGIITSWNNGCQHLFGYSAEEMVGQSLLKLLPPDRVDEEQFIMHEISSGGRIDHFETVRLCKNDSPVDVSVSQSPIFDSTGKVIGASKIARNITERKLTEEKLRLSSSVFTHAWEGILITTMDGTIVDVNDAFSRITGYSRDEVLGETPRILGSGLQGQAFYADLWNSLIQKGHWYGEIWNRRKSGEMYAIIETISAVNDAQGIPRHYVAMLTDITRIKEHENELEHIAHYDPLTNLPNRILLADRMRQGITQVHRRNTSLAVVFLDLDGFKAINDKHGHETGDRLLMAIASRMLQAIREGDTFARIGGDEFVAVLMDLDNEDITLQLLNRLLSAAFDPVQFVDMSLQVSASLGVAFYPQKEAVDADQLLRQADQAMYQAKLAGKNRYHVFDATLDHSIRTRNESLDRIRSAIIEQEFALYYQPKVNLRTGAIIGAEALIRWNHPEKGLLSPESFLPEIEDHPLAIELGEWVIHNALNQIELWRQHGLDIQVSVNVSARQLQQSNFVTRLCESLAAHPNIMPSYLEIEVLETSALEDITKTTRLINDCRKFGVSFALDDFGTGYSSLTYLKQLPVSLLKIDQSFVRNMLHDSDDLAIIEAVVGLARTFRLHVIAEGVETVEHGTLLLQLGCELAQGYGIARPMPADQLLKWAMTWRPHPAWGK